MMCYDISRIKAMAGKDKKDQGAGQEFAQVGAWEQRVPELPTSPGVYVFRDKKGTVLYVGKAKSLKARVRAYTKEHGDGRPHVEFLRRRIRGLEYIVTDTEQEALILENNLIKKHRPRYNIRLRDDKTYFHLKLTAGEEFPRLLLARRPDKRGKDLLLGPFSSSAAVKETIRTLQEIFPLRRCRQRFRASDRACLNFQIGNCMGPCAGHVSKEEYQEVVGQAVKFLKGRSPELVSELKKRMLAASEAEEFELAATLRDRILAIEKTLEAQKVDSVKPVDRDVLGFYREGDRVSIHRLGYRGGALLISESRGFSRVKLSDEDALSSFISQLYPDRAAPPDEVLVPFEPSDLDLILKSLSRALGKKAWVRAPQRGEGKRLVELAGRNAAEALRTESEKTEDRERAMQELRRRLRLSQTPRWIECVDISMLGGEHAVGSVVRFVDGDPEKSGYRRYRIKNAAGANDYDMMREVLTRRFRRALDEGKDLPRLLVVDGGKGQLNVARAVLKELGIREVELAALAKDREIGGPRSDELKKKGERVFRPGVKDPVNIKPGTAGLFLLQRVRDEAHRFAMDYHKKLRSKKMKRSTLEEIPGIGPKKAAALIKRFRGIKRIGEAGVEEIAKAPGIGRIDAENIKNFFGQDEDN
jgi:excinuclease ABC subunit C